MASVISEVYPGIEWRTEARDGIYWIGGFAENGREEMRGVPMDDMTGPNTADTLSRVCTEIANALRPTFIDWSDVGALDQDAADPKGP